MSKVLFLVNHDLVIYNFRIELVEELIKQGHQVFVSCPYGERIIELENIGCKCFDIAISRHSRNPIKDMALIFNYVKLINNLNPDIIFSYTIKPNIYGTIASRIKKIPIVCNITGLGSSIENGGITEFVTKFLYKLVIKHAYFVFFQNEENLQYFIKNKIKIRKYDLLPGSGVNVEKFSYQKLPLNNSFAYVARIMKDKGIEEYLAAAKQIKTAYPNVTFHICGFCDDDYQRVINDYQKQGIIIYHGMVKNMNTMYSQFDCIVLPSYFEGMSNSILEASASGRIVIASNIHGCLEAVDDDKTGYLFKAKDVKSLRETMEKVINLSREKKEEMGINARAKIIKEFDRRIIIEKYLDVLKTL